MSRSILIRKNKNIYKISNYREMGKPSKENQANQEFLDLVRSHGEINLYKRGVPYGTFTIKSIDKLSIPEPSTEVNIKVEAYDPSTDENYLIHFDGVWKSSWNKDDHLLPDPISVKPITQLTTFQKFIGRKNKNPDPEWVNFIKSEVSSYLISVCLAAKKQFGLIDPIEYDPELLRHIELGIDLPDWYKETNWYKKNK